MKRLAFKQCLYSFILLLTGCLVIVACSDDDIPVTPSQPEIPALTATVASITVDPSGFCPLAARIRINTSGGVAIRATVLPKPNAVTPAQEHLFPYSTESAQFIDVLGLYSNYTNQVKLAFLDAQGIEHADTLIEIRVDSLNIPNVPQVRRVLKADVSRMEPGMNLALFTPSGENDTSMPYMVDADGEIRYLLNWRNSEKMVHTIFNAAFSRMKDGNWLTADNNTGFIQIVSPLGEWIRSYDFMTTNKYRFHHEAREMANGNLICNMTKLDAVRADGVTKRIQDHIVEWNPKTGAIAHAWDLANMLDTVRGANVLDLVPQEQSLTDWMHNNAITDCGDDYIATSRFQGVFKFKSSGELMWILAPHRGWHEQYQHYLLTPLDRDGNVITDPAVVDGSAHTDDFDWVWGPHAAVVLSGNDNNIGGKRHRILVYDNGVTRNFIPNKNQVPYSRAVIYEIDEEKKTVSQVWDYGKDMPEYFTATQSNAAYLPQTGHILFCPSGGAVMSSGKRGACILEIDPTTNEVVYHLELDNSGGFHRAYRLPLYFD
jgi:arylsulfate sulfotransferase